MDYVFHFGPILDRWPLLLWGLSRTLELSLVSMVFGLAIGILGAVAKSFGPRPVAALASAYVELIRNTPLLIQLYFIFFTLPFIGLRLSSDTAAIVALSIHLGAYATEIVRAGIESIPAGQIEAGKALGLSGRQIIRHIVIVPAIRAVYPALGGQFILQLLGSSIVSAIAAEELTAIANNLVMQTFRNFEIYIVVAVMYFVVVQAFIMLFRLGGRLLFRWKV
ncbi:amino acid ABC transporter permease [Bauldia litoralis]|uniref:Polar amino acid transport system permease protein n=1 Tax=Bauldia litoralis TaxID=665467 RepID=A0A1G6CA68_9HYPH|nr:amino acid ABC transporter permease [Bauldia litoralis]SDB29701.1 polar amino acid transport system permease protein [Bauldia litoralis]